MIKQLLCPGHSSRISRISPKPFPILFLALFVLTATGCTESDPPPEKESIDSFVYQLTNYPDGRLDELITAPHDLAVIDLARDGGTDYFTVEEIKALRNSGKRVLAYFSMGTIETYRPEYDTVSEAGLELNNWGDWPDEYFVRYWEPEWWELAVKGRVDQAIAAGFDGVYLDVPNAYEEIDLSLVPEEDRESLARKMVDQVVRISEYAKAKSPGFWIFPQNSPELRHYKGYTEAIDGLGIEDLFFLDTDIPCNEDWCAENLANTRALQQAGKLILAVDYAGKPGNISYACDRYVEFGFAGYVTVVELNRVLPPCGE
ncbi:endo alpha-1,4 polygalactosaminidase [Sinomicrobium weinanense]|uniref:Endo alpha-1,4 polygalactosaminidase n=1 Tax=Sinomicrobium weinanense TaxID=2842200 RepID=A0A926JVJ0_9FLAO|nr:endo alpha-1,4 polygalactosaminidase [Sinomicrobium weinanense]MBC9798358.1 endo alpha-1,4 polygalactosaminidase [Sinomicrobium weinanense]MBU3122431.1 endo alpha-1,4 polygalactosaminidase [Sinomicrobium weinanense]